MEPQEIRELVKESVFKLAEMNLEEVAEEDWPSFSISIKLEKLNLALLEIAYQLSCGGTKPPFTVKNP
jgi:hypothetical protein